MIEIDIAGLVGVIIMAVLIGVVIGTKTSAHRWIEYEEWKAWKAKKNELQ